MLLSGDDYGMDKDEMMRACEGDSPVTDAESGRLLDCSIDTCPTGTYCRRSAGDTAGRRSTARCCPKGTLYLSLYMTVAINYCP